MERRDLPSRSRSKVGSSSHRQVLVWREKAHHVFAVLNVERESRKTQQGKKGKKKKSLFFSCLLFLLSLFPPPPQYIPPSSVPFYPTPSWLLPAAARSRCHHLFLYFPHLGSCNTSWLSFLADSVISARPQAGRAPRPTGDPCGCSTAGRRLCTEETARQRGCLAPLHLAV